MLHGLTSPSLIFAVMWMFTVDISSVFLYFPTYLPFSLWTFAVFWKDDLVSSTRCSFWADFSARGWILVLWLWIHFHPSLDTVAPMVGKESLLPTSIWDWTQKEEGKEWVFSDAPPAHVAGTYSSLYGVKEGVSSSLRLFGSLRGWGE